MIDEGLGLLTATFLAIVLLLIFPIYQEFQQQESLIQLQLVQDVDWAVQQISEQGKLDKLLYEQLLTKINRSGYAFEVEISRQERKVYPLESGLPKVNAHSQVALVYEEISSEQILAELYADNNQQAYYFKKGDYVRVTAKSTALSHSDRWLEIFWRTKLDRPSFYASIAGVVAHETD